jgi:dehydrogenase/reductase SDR family protein 1
MAEMGDLGGRVAVVAGASRGIGKGIALEVAVAGATVYVAGRTVTATTSERVAGTLDDTVRDIEQLGGKAIAVRCDCTDDRDVADLFDLVHAEQGRLDLLVNSVFNARNFRASIGRHFWELPVSIWHDVVDVGTRSAYVTAAYAAPLLMASGGLIVNVSGRGASRYRYNVAYGVGKAALDKMTADMAEELKPHGVGVISLWPNVTRTETVSESGTVEPTGTASPDVDLRLLETPRYSGRAVVALACDPHILRRTGRRFWVAEIGSEYGLTDEYGRTHPLPD